MLKADWYKPNRAPVSSMKTRAAWHSREGHPFVMNQTSEEGQIASVGPSSVAGFVSRMKGSVAEISHPVFPATECWRGRIVGSHGGYVIVRLPWRGSHAFPCSWLSAVYPHRSWWRRLVDWIAPPKVNASPAPRLTEREVAMLQTARR